MKTLVAVASRHGSTHEIARAIADELRTRGLDVELRDAGEVDSLDGYDAVVLGSAVYMGDWLAEARRLVERHRERLAALPVWLFSSGPLGAEDPKPHGDPERIAGLLAAVRPRGHRVFVGKLDKGALSLGERLAAKLVRAPEGDFRDWDAIREWADEIAAERSHSS
jgi:menaquinone-dependent protoporphyrinogen oxidase